MVRDGNAWDSLTSVIAAVAAVSEQFGANTEIMPGAGDMEEEGRKGEN